MTMERHDTFFGALYHEGPIDHIEDAVENGDMGIFIRGGRPFAVVVAGYADDDPTLLRGLLFAPHADGIYLEGVIDTKEAWGRFTARHQYDETFSPAVAIGMLQEARRHWALEESHPTIPVNV